MILDGFFSKAKQDFFVFLFISSRYFHGNRKCQNELTGSSWRSWVKKEKVLVMFTDWSHFRPNWGLGNRWRKMSTAHKQYCCSPRRSINSERTANRENWPPCETILSHSKINFIVNLPKVFPSPTKISKNYNFRLIVVNFVNFVAKSGAKMAIFWLKSDSVRCGLWPCEYLKRHFCKKNHLKFHVQHL